MNGKIVLTSTGLSSENIKNYCINLFSNLAKKSVAIITTAAENKENNKYSKLAYEQFKNLSFSNIEFVDLEVYSGELDSFSVIYVCGGDTFKLIKAAQNSNFSKQIINLLERGGIYIGVSAGSIILGNSVKIAVDVAPDEDHDSSILDNFEGLKILNVDIHPHYSKNDDVELENYKRNIDYEIETIDNSEAIIFENYKKITKIN
jgi:dipeptidase E